MALNMLIQPLQQLAFTVSNKEAVQPCQAIVFLGTLLETNYDGNGGMMVTVPEENLRRAESLALQLSKAQHTYPRASCSKHWDTSTTWHKSSSPRESTCAA